jgi:hypothetical protein
MLCKITVDVYAMKDMHTNDRTNDKIESVRQNVQYRKISPRLSGGGVGSRSAGSYFEADIRYLCLNIS